MTTYELNKRCEHVLKSGQKCDAPIPDEFGNLLCTPCYAEIEAEKYNKHPVYIREDGYVEHEEANELDLASRMAGRFKGTGFVMPVPQRKIYEAVMEEMKNDIGASPHYPKFIYKKTVIDIGCGLGIGSNILSKEAKFVWGIDKNPESVTFAKQMFERMPNNLYQSGQLSFDTVDVKDFPREIMKFDYIVCVEVIEHLKDPMELINFIKRVSTESTNIFISTPNRNADNIQKDTPKNPHHVREYTAGEFYDLLTKSFKSVTLFAPDMKTTIDLDGKVTPMLAKCQGLI